MCLDAALTRARGWAQGWKGRARASDLRARPGRTAPSQSCGGRCGEDIFLVLGCLTSGLLILENPNLRFAALLAVSIWAFARAYYFAFYVIEHYVDPGYKYAGLLSLLRYLVRERSMREGRKPGEDA